MQIAFVHSFYENLGIEYLSSSLKKEGHEVRLFFDPLLFDNYLIKNNLLQRIFTFKERLIRSLAESSPHIVAFSSSSVDYKWCCEMAKEIKEQLDTIIIFGGSHVTAVPENVLNNEFVDYVICGDGEAAMVEFVNALEKNQDVREVKNLGYKENGNIFVNDVRPLSQDIDSIPFPDKDMFYNEYKDFVSESYMIITSRGCVYNCSYCGDNMKNKIYGKYYRRRTTDNVIDELKIAKEKYNIKRVNFQDSVFCCDQNWLDEFLPKYKKEIGLPFFCFLYPAKQTDEGLVNRLVEAGCVTVNMGIQSIDPEARKSLFLRHETNEEIEKTIEAIKKSRLYLYLDFILYPSQTEEELIQTIKFCSNMKVDFVAAFWLVFFPGTEAINIFKKKGLLDDEGVKNIEDGREFRPYFDIKDSYYKLHSKIANVLYVSGVLPRKMVDAIIKHKFYRFLPATNLYMPCNIVVGAMKNLFSRKVSFSTGSALSYFCKYYFVYICKIVFKR